MRILIIILLVAAASAVPASEKMEAVVDGHNSLACDLYRQLAAEDGNVFFSPTSIFTALAMTHGGARGETAAEMARTLHFPADPKTLHAGNHALLQTLATEEDQATQLAVANRLWPDRTLQLEDAFLNLCRSNYRAEPEAVDFAGDSEGARTIINRWAEENTRGMITDLLHRGDLDPSTLLVLTNAIHFKGLWSSPFDPERTRPWPFYRVDGSTVQADFMHQDGEFAHGRTDGVQVLQLPYTDSDLAMLLVLPDSKDGLKDLESRLDSATVTRWVAALETTPLSVVLPRFDITCRKGLKDDLRNLGMKLAFGPQADFSGMTGTRVFIDQVIHQARIIIDEEGTEAAGATAVIMRKSARPTFVANHPFLLLIRDTRAGAIVFMGRVSDPS